MDDMTIDEAKSKVIFLATAEVGYCEGNNNWNKYAAELDPMNLTWGSKQNQPWCGEFVLWVFYKCFGADKALEMLCSTKPSSIPLCSAGADYFKRAGRWHDKPELGDVVFYIYDGGINHTGIVVGVSGEVIATVEGNSHDKVSRNSYVTSNKVIAGYGRPKWYAVGNEPKNDEPKMEPEISGLPFLKRGDKGEVVRAAQFLLNGRDFSCGIWGADGDFGNMTEAAVLAFQRRNGLEADGIIGRITWSYLLGLRC